MKLTALKKYFGVIYAFMFYLLMVVALTLLAYFLDFSYESIALGSYIVSTLSVFAAGILCARGSQKLGWLVGLCGAMAALLLIVLFGRLLGGETDWMHLLLRMPTFVACGIVGGIIGINIK